MIHRSRSAALGAAALSLLLAGCSGSGTSSVPPAGNNASTTSSSSGLKSTTSSNGKLTYDTNPPYKLAYQSGSIPAALPSPSQCVALFGVACYTPQLIRSAYNVPANATGAGQTIVIVDAYGSDTIAQDLQTFDRVFGLPDPPSFQIVYPGGKPTVNSGDPKHAPGSWAGEVSLDVEWSHALAPQANIVLVVAATSSGDVLNNAVDYAVSNHLGSVVSMSYGAPEAAIKALGGANNTQVQQAHKTFANAQAAGITMIASSGDTGASNGASFANAGFPASDPLVLSVGGTNLLMSDSGAYQSESVWNDSVTCPFPTVGCPVVYGATGGAPSELFAAPSFQSAVSGNTARSTSDVSYNASVYTAVLVVEGGSIYFFGGTSEGSPQWAGIIADANALLGHSLGYVTPQLYAAANSGAFHDVTVGNNALSGTPGFPAQPGYDYPTGIGSPNVGKLLSVLH